MKNREKILAKAAELIHVKGFNHTSIQDILEAASVKKSNFYYHFDSKEQLGFEVLALRMRQFYKMAIAPALVEGGVEPRARIHAFLDRLALVGMSEAGERGCPFGNLAQEISALHEPLRESLSGFFNACTEALEGCLEEGKKTGAFRIDTPSRRIAEFILGQIQGAFLLRKTHKDPEVIKRSVEMLRVFLDMWTAPAREPGEPEPATDLPPEFAGA